MEDLQYLEHNRRALFDEVKFGHSSHPQRQHFRGGGVKQLRWLLWAILDPQFLNFCTSVKLTRREMKMSWAIWKFQVNIMTGTCCILIHFFSRVRNELKMMVSGLNHLLGRVKSPEWVGHLPRWCGRAETGPGVIHHANIALGTSDLQRPLEAKPNRQR